MAKIRFGKYTYGEITTIYGFDEGIVNVGKYCSIGGEVKVFFARDHNIRLISTYPFGSSVGPKGPYSPPLPTTENPVKDHDKVSVINIGNDVWIGYGVILFRDVTVGDGCAIGAFSKITKDIPPYSVVVGDSRIVRRRFLDEDIDFLLKLKWWDLPDSEVREIMPILHNPDLQVLKDWAKSKGFSC